MSIVQSVVIPTAFQHPQRTYELSVYRGDLEHTRAPGNKLHKLKYHLEQAKRLGATTIATFGGPFSNHLHAFGLMLEHSGFKGICVVRGEIQPRLTPTLNDVQSVGVELWPSSRLDYRLGVKSQVAQQINERYPDVYWIPEGGGGKLGAKGCMDWATNIEYLAGEYDAWLVSAGTGTTAAGLLASPLVPHLHVISALKGAKEQRKEILDLAKALLENKAEAQRLDNKLDFHDSAHEGGYARLSEELVNFLHCFAKSNPALPLDPVYTAKTLFYVLKEMRAGRWPYQRTLVVHTGGLQGWRGYPIDSNPFLTV